MWNRKEYEETLMDIAISLLIDSSYAKRHVLIRNQEEKLFSIIRLQMQNHASEDYF